MLKAPEGLRRKEQPEPHSTVKHRESADSVGRTTQANLTRCSGAISAVPYRDIQ